MNIRVPFVRILFFILSMILMISVGASHHPTPQNYILGGILGLIATAGLFAADLLLKRFSLRFFNLTTLGLFFGYLLSLALMAILNAMLDIASISLNPSAKIFVFLLGTYLGVSITLRNAGQISVSIPFVKFTPQSTQTKDIVLDFSTLCDPRLIDLASSGLLDKRLLLPRFLLNELQQQEQVSDDFVRARAKRALEVVKKLEALPNFGLRYQDTDFPDVKDITEKVVHLARLLDANILSADITHVQVSQIEGVRIINIHALSNALKPLMQRGESMKIEIQHEGKGERQGVGYLEDGTMVVVNGGGDFIGQLIEAFVLSVKHTSAGRMIFCNVAKDKEHAKESLL